MVTSMPFYQWTDLASYVSKHSNGESIFSGEISDGVHNFGFAQFATILDHPVYDFREYSDKMANYIFGPTFLKSIWEGTYKDDFVFNVLKQRLENRTFDEPSGTPENLSCQLLSSFFLRDNRFPFWSLDNSNILTKQGREFYSNEMEASYIQEPAHQVTPETLYSWYIHLYNSFHWQGGTVATLPITADVHGLEMCLPFRDTRIQNFLSAMPESWGRGLELKPTKYPLKWMLENYIDYPLHLQVGPHSYLYDIDPEFHHEKEWIYHSAFNAQYKEIVKKRKYQEILSSEIFNLEYYDQIVSNYLENEIVHSESADLGNLIFLSAMGWFE